MRGRPKIVSHPVKCMFYLGARQLEGLERLRAKRGERKRSETMRSLLDMIADLEGVPPDSLECFEEPSATVSVAEGVRA